LQRPRIPVIDDDPAIQKLVFAALTLTGYEVHVSGRPEEALEQPKSSDYDLSLLDLRMPGMDGEDVFQI
jgi:DNA-binding response OmpR family regulator